MSLNETLSILKCFYFILPVFYDVAKIVYVANFLDSNKKHEKYNRDLFSKC